MSKLSIKDVNPEKYKAVKSNQNTMVREIEGLAKMGCYCPYCDHKVIDIVKGSHGYISIKCPKCGERVVFPPVFFRIAY